MMRIFEKLSTARPAARFWTGAALVLAVLVVGFAWAGAAIPNWGAAPADITRALPGDAQAAQPQIVWNHAITIQAAPEDIYPWLAQIGDTRGGFYSYTFIENKIMALTGTKGTYANAGSIHPEWQSPAPGQGVITNVMAIQETQPGKYVLAGATPAMAGVHWTWLWYLDPLGPGTTRLVVRHRAQFPPEAPVGLIRAVFNAGYVMERGMLRGIRDRAEGRIPPAPLEGSEVVLWLAVFAAGVAAAARFIRKPGRWHPLGVGLEALVVLFIYTYVQPVLWVRLLLLLGLALSLWIAFQPGRVSARVRRLAHASR